MQRYNKIPILRCFVTNKSKNSISAFIPKILFSESIFKELFIYARNINICSIE